MAKRVLVATPPEAGETITLSPAESHHLTVVRRAKQGEAVELLDGQGGVGRGIVQVAHKAQTTVLIDAWETRPALRPAVTLAVAIPKNKTMDVVIHQATELGVHEIIPLLTDNGEVLPKGDRAQEKRQKWQQIVREAQKQCGNPWTPKVHTPTKLMDFLDHFSASDEWGTRVVAALHPDAQTLQSVLRGQQNGARVAVAVGSEGDFSPAEYQALFAANWKPVTLGSLILKVDTACVALVSQVLATEW